MSITGTSKETQKVRVLNKVFYICYSVQFQKDKNKDILVLLDFGNKINTITSAYAAQLGLKIERMNIGTQKIDWFLLKIYNMLIAAFQVFNKFDSSYLF